MTIPGRRLYSQYRGGERGSPRAEQCPDDLADGQMGSTDVISGQLSVITRVPGKACFDSAGVGVTRTQLGNR